ncbi:unnamed protein product [Rhizophagus irregularis]|nr:unnamed protein product [Rhizophagus irregularis]
MQFYEQETFSNGVISFLFLDFWIFSAEGDFIEGISRITPTTPQNSLGANQRVLDLSIPIRDPAPHSMILPSSWIITWEIAHFLLTLPPVLLIPRC